MLKILFFLNHSLTLQLHIVTDPRYGIVAGAIKYCKSVYQALILGYTELSNFQINVKNEATIDAFRV